MNGYSADLSGPYASGEIERVASLLQMGRINIMASMERKNSTNGTNTCNIPGYLKVPGVIQARRFVAVDGAAEISDGLRVRNPGVPDTKEWMAARDSILEPPGACRHAAGRRIARKSSNDFPQTLIRTLS